MESLMRYISRTSRCGVLYRTDKLEKYGLGGHQNVYIQNICRSPGISQDRLAKMIFVNKSTVTRQMALLEQNGFVTRQVSGQDKRQMLLYPTEKAVKLYPIIQEVLRGWNDRLLEDFTEQERQILGSMLKKVMEKAVFLSSQTAEEGRENP